MTSQGLGTSGLKRESHGTLKYVKQRRFELLLELGPVVYLPGPRKQRPKCLKVVPQTESVVKGATDTVPGRRMKSQGLRNERTIASKELPCRMLEFGIRSFA